MSKKSLERAIKFFVYLTFFVPLVVMPTSFIFPFIVPKILLFRSLVTIVVALYVVLLFLNWQQYRPKFSAVSLAVFGFLLSFALSTFFGTDSYHSFWDNHERMLGLFTIAHYVAYFFVCSQIFRTWDEWKNALRIFLLAGSFVMIVGIIQIFKPTYLLNGGSARIIATLGNAIYVGGYGLFLFFVSLLLFLKESHRTWRLVYVVGALLALVGLFYSGTRGTMLGLLVGLCVGLVSYIFVLKDHKNIRNSLIGVVLAVFVLLGFAYANRTTEFVQKIPALGRVLNIGQQDFNSPRVLAWQAAISAWKQRPFFGWGPNNFFYAFNANYNPKSFEFGYGETWFDNAHNIILNTLAVQGTVGLLTYLAVFAVTIYSLVSAYRQGYIDRHFAIIGSTFLVAHLIQNITVFENPTSYLYFMFWLALMNAMVHWSKKISNKDAEVAPNRNVSLPFAITILTFFALLVFIFNVQPARANMKSLEALQAINYDPVFAESVIQSALSFSSPHIDDIRDDISRTLIGALGNTSKKISPEKKLELFALAEGELSKNIGLHPRDIRVQLTLAQLFQTKAMQNNDFASMLKAESYLTGALELSPKRQQIIYNLAIVKLQIGKAEEGIKLFEGAIIDDPKIAETYIRLANTYKIIGERAKAIEVLNLAKTNGVAFNPVEQSTVDQMLAEFATKTKK